MRVEVFCCALVLLLWSGLWGQSQPLVDHHQHLFNPANLQLSPEVQQITASDLIALLDLAGIRRATVLSVAYQFGNPNRPPVENEYEKVKAENDWTSQQVAQYPDRLRGFCGVNPLKGYAVAEVKRCAKDPQLHFGLKLHFGNSDVDLGNPKHVAQLRRVFREANQQNMAIVIHMHPSVLKQRSYGATQARVFLEKVLPAAPDVPVQIAHLAGAGGYDDPSVDEAVAIFVDAVRRGDKRMEHVYFDVSGIAGLGQWEQKFDLIALRIRQLGVGRILYGSDGAGGKNLSPREAWAAFRRLPLSEVEFRTIEKNVAPYMK